MYQPTTKCKGLPWKAGRYLPDQEIICFYRIWRFTTVFTWACNCNTVKNNYNMSICVSGFLWLLTNMLSMRSSGMLWPVTKLASSLHSVTCAPLLVVTTCHKSFLSLCQSVSPSWRKLHNDELHNLYSSPSIIRIIKPWRKRWAEHVAQMGSKKNAYRILVGKPEWKRPLGRPWHRWVVNITTYLR
jgi:hypothetical protein